MSEDIEQMKIDAAIAADQIDIRWDNLENPEYRADFENTLKRAAMFVPELEGLYKALINGESVTNPGEQSSLPYVDIEKYSDLVAEELFNGYVLRSLYHKYEAIENVMRAALDNAD
jgi:hypothetical protein